MPDKVSLMDLMLRPDTNYLSGTAVSGSYKTSLPLLDELKFQDWVRRNRIPFADSPQSDYDMRGYWKALTAGDPNARTQISAFDNQPHFPDTYKTPYHRSFSRESIYATENAPQWQGDVLRDRLGNIIADERKRK